MKPRAALVIITTSFPRAGDGSEAAGAFVDDLARLIATGRPVRVVAPGSTAERQTWSEGIEVFRFPAPEEALSTLRPWIPGDLRKIVRVMKAGGNAARTAATSGPTAHILALWTLPSGYWARQLRKELGIPYSIWALGSDIWSLGRIPFIRWQLRRVMQDADRCFADGLKLADDAGKIGGREFEFLPSARSIDSARTKTFRETPPFRLLYLGRWHSNKGTDLLMDSLQLLSEEDWKRIESIKIYGGGPLKQTVMAGVSKLTGSGRPVVLGGYLEKEASIEAFLRADFLMIPSRVESIPLVFSDAAKLGCPVISMPVGDLPELISEGTGVHATGVTASEFAAAIHSALLRSPAEFQKGLDRVAREFSIRDSIAPRIEQLMGFDRNGQE